MTILKTDVCLRAKSHKLPHNTTRDRSIRLVEFIHSDIMGPVFPPSINDKNLISFIDDYSNFNVLFILQNRSEAAACFAQCHKTVIARFSGINIIELRNAK